MNPGLVKIGWFEADSLPDMSMPVFSVQFPSSPVWINLVESGTISEEIKYSSLGSQVSTKLDFVSEDDIPMNSKIAFIVKDADGRSYLVGNKPPHCGLLSRTAVIEKPDGRASVSYYSFSIPFRKILL